MYWSRLGGTHIVAGPITHASRPEIREQMLGNVSRRLRSAIRLFPHAESPLTWVGEVAQENVAAERENNELLRVFCRSHARPTLIRILERLCERPSALAVTILVLCSCNVAPVHSESSLGCPDGLWIGPQLLAQAPAGERLSFPSLTMTRAQRVVAAVALPARNEGRMPDPSTRIYNIQGRDLGLPPAAHRVAFPQVFSASDSTVTLIWASSTTQPGLYDFSSAMAGPFTSLWVATLSDELHWSQPNRILEAAAIGWDPWLSSEPFVAQDRTWVLAIVAKPTGSRRSQIHLLRGGPNKPTEIQLLPLDGLYSYASAASKRAFLYVAWVGVGRGAPGANNVLFRRSADGGATWDSSIPVHVPAPNLAFEVRLLVSANGELHVIWVERGEGDALLGHAASNDNGESWAVSDQLRIRGGLSMLRAVLDSCGAIHALYRTDIDPNVGGRIGYAIWDRIWKPQRFPFGDLRGDGLGLSLGSDQSLHAVFGARHASSSAETLQLYHALRPAKSNAAR
jgi:hypothetical protein